MSQAISATAISTQIKQLKMFAKRYYGIIFFVFVGSLYIFLVIQIGNFVNAQPDESSINADTAKKLRVDKDIADQLQKLRDNSVNVQAIPSTDRSNPFEE